MSENEKRLSLRIGPALAALMQDGHCAASTLTKRLDLLATRYAKIIDTTKLPTWPIETWAAFITIAKAADLTAPGAFWAIQGAARDAGQTKLVYAMESITPVQQLAIIAKAERYAGDSSESDLLAYLGDAAKSL